eukprot:1194694-Prorocentrum_minimum.AAC.7
MTCSRLASLTYFIIASAWGGQRAYPFWNISGGADHLYAISGDFGLRTSVPDILYGNAIGLVHVRARLRCYQDVEQTRSSNCFAFSRVRGAAPVRREYGEKCCPRVQAGARYCNPADHPSGSPKHPHLPHRRGHTAHGALLRRQIGLTCSYSLLLTLTHSYSLLFAGKSLLLALTQSYSLLLALTRGKIALTRSFSLLLALTHSYSLLLTPLRRQIALTRSYSLLLALTHSYSLLLALLRGKIARKSLLLALTGSYSLFFAGKSLLLTLTRSYSLFFAGNAAGEGPGGIEWG